MEFAKIFAESGFEKYRIFQISLVLVKKDVGIGNEPSRGFGGYISDINDSNMRRKQVNVLLLVGVALAIVLLMVWLFLGTTLEEDSTRNFSPLEQT